MATVRAKRLLLGTNAGRLAFADRGALWTLAPGGVHHPIDPETGAAAGEPVSFGAHVTDLTRLTDGTWIATTLGSQRQLVAIDSRTGERRWTRPYGEVFGAGALAIVVNDSQLEAVSGTGEVVGRWTVDGVTGVLAWRSDLIVTTAENVVSLASTGEERWSMPRGLSRADPRRITLVLGARVWVVDFDEDAEDQESRLVCLDPESGRVEATRRVPRSLWRVSPAADFLLAQRPASRSDVMVFDPEHGERSVPFSRNLGWGDAAGSVAAIVEATQVALAWRDRTGVLQLARVPLPGSFTGGPVVLDGNVYVGRDHVLLRFDTATMSAGSGAHDLEIEDPPGRLPGGVLHSENAVHVKATSLRDPEGFPPRGAVTPLLRARCDERGIPFPSVLAALFERGDGDERFQSSLDRVGLLGIHLVHDEDELVSFAEDGSNDWRYALCRNPETGGAAVVEITEEGGLAWVAGDAETFLRRVLAFARNRFPKTVERVIAAVDLPAGPQAHDAPAWFEELRQRFEAGTL